MGGFRGFHIIYDFTQDPSTHAYVSEVMPEELALELAAVDAADRELTWPGGTGTRTARASDHE